MKMNYISLIISLLTLIAIDSTAQKPFITSWQVDANETINIPLSNIGNYDFNYCWKSIADPVGTCGVHTRANGTFSTTFASGGVYFLEITGAFPHFQGYPKTKLLDVLQWGDIQWLSTKEMFMDWSGTHFSALDAPNLTQATDMKRMFKNAVNFNLNIGHWNTSNIIFLEEIFKEAKVFNGNIGLWDVSKVTKMDNLFQSNHSFNQDIGAWNVNNVTSMSGMFNDTRAFNQNIGNWDVSKVINMNGMFRNALVFNQNISSWNVGKVTNMESMFQTALAFNQDISFWNVNSVTNMRQMFDNADSFNQPIGKWNVNNNLSFREMFRQNDAFDQNLGNWVLNPLASYLSVFTSASAFSCKSWSNTIIGWERNNPSLTNISIGGPNAPYDTVAAKPRDRLLSKGWTINGTAFDGLCTDPPCPQDLVLNDTISSGTYLASGSISSNGIIEDGALVKFVAMAVNLEKGFKAPLGTVFSVDIQAGCSQSE